MHPHRRPAGRTFLIVEEQGGVETLVAYFVEIICDSTNNQFECADERRLQVLRKDVKIIGYLMEDQSDSVYSFHLQNSANFGAGLAISKNSSPIGLGRSTFTLCGGCVAPTWTGIASPSTCWGPSGLAESPRTHRSPRRFWFRQRAQWFSREQSLRAPPGRPRNANVKAKALTHRKV